VLVFAHSIEKLYTYVGNDPLDKTDPTGLVEIDFGLEAELFIGGGTKLGGEVSFDTQTLEVGAKGTFGIGGGLNAGVGLVGSISPSSTEPARSTTTTSTSIVGSANLGPFAISKEVPVTENGESVIPKPGSTSGSVTKEVALPKVVEGLKPQLKAGASVSVDYSGKKTSAGVANAVDAVKRTISTKASRLSRSNSPRRKPVPYASPAPSPTDASCNPRRGSQLLATSPPCVRDQSASVGERKA
jgi:hypothetical protein